ncbi:hypothetical protein JVU11DRAFT_6664 [Chiua virens]|nr:hypothetical protein JVU11DRAFT_6664 [Chiua virens]
MICFMVPSISTFFYYVHYPKDRTGIKAFVAAVWAFNTIHEALSISGTYKYIMTGLLIPDSYQIGNPEMILQILPTLLVTIHMRAFFVYRIYIVTGKKIIVPLIWIVLATLQLVIVLYYLANALYSVNGQVQAVELSKLASNPIITLITTLPLRRIRHGYPDCSFMIILLRRKRTAAGFASTVHIFQRLAIFAINTGIWPAVLSLLTVILLHAFPTTTIYFIPRMPLCAVYSNTLLANLNARTYIGGGATTQFVDLDLFARQGSEVSAQTEAQDRNGEIPMRVFSSPRQMPFL